MASGRCQRAALLSAPCTEHVVAATLEQCRGWTSLLEDTSLANTCQKRSNLDCGLARVDDSTAKTRYLCAALRGEFACSPFASPVSAWHSLDTQHSLNTQVADCERHHLTTAPCHQARMVPLRVPQVFWDKFLGRKHRWKPFLPLEFPGGLESMMPTRDDTPSRAGEQRLSPFIAAFESQRDAKLRPHHTKSPCALMYRARGFGECSVMARA